MGATVDPLLGGKGTKKRLYEPLGEADAVTYLPTTEQSSRAQLTGLGARSH